MANIFSFQLDETFLSGYASYLKQLREQNPGKAYKVTISVDLIPDGIGYEIREPPQITIDEEPSSSTVKEADEEYERSLDVPLSPFSETEENVMRLFNLKKTCEASPAQWLATNEQGEHVYIRYRFDRLTVHCPYNPNDERDYEAFMAVQILDMNHVHDDAFSGSMDTDEMLALTGYSLMSRANQKT